MLVKVLPFLLVLLALPLQAEPTLHVVPSVRQHTGILVSEQCSEVGCSRLTYPRSFVMRGIGLQFGSVGSPWRYSLHFASTDGSIKQSSLTDTDVDYQNAPIYIDGPRIDFYKLHFRDSPYGYSGGHLWSSAFSELKTYEYSGLLGLERIVTDSWRLQSELDYAYSVHRRQNVLGAVELTGNNPVVIPNYSPSFGTYTANRLAFRLGFATDYRLTEDLSMQFRFLPSVGLFSAKDARPEQQRFYRSYTFGGGVWLSADLYWKLSDRLDMFLGFFQHRLYTKGNGEFYGQATYYLRVSTPGWSVNLKEGGGSFGMKVRLF